MFEKQRNLNSRNYVLLYIFLVSRWRASNFSHGQTSNNCGKFSFLDGRTKFSKSIASFIKHCWKSTEFNSFFTTRTNDKRATLPHSCWELLCKSSFFDEKTFQHISKKRTKHLFASDGFIWFIWLDLIWFDLIYLVSLSLNFSSTQFLSTIESLQHFPLSFISILNEEEDKKVNLWITGRNNNALPQSNTNIFC